MSKNLVYKQTTQTMLKAVGFFDKENMCIEIDGDAISINDLLDNFANKDIELSIKISNSEDLDLEGNE